MIVKYFTPFLATNKMTILSTTGYSVWKHWLGAPQQVPWLIAWAKPTLLKKLLGLRVTHNRTREKSPFAWLVRAVPPPSQSPQCSLSPSKKHVVCPISLSTSEAGHSGRQGRIFIQHDIPWKQSFFTFGRLSLQISVSTPPFCLTSQHCFSVSTESQQLSCRGWSWDILDIFSSWQAWISSKTQDLSHTLFLLGSSLLDSPLGTAGPIKDFNHQLKIRATKDTGGLLSEQGFAWDSLSFITGPHQQPWGLTGAVGRHPTTLLRECVCSHNRTHKVSFFILEAVKALPSWLVILLRNCR